VKKMQRSFAVEYKSGRRKTHSVPKSIWGDVDLSSVARELDKAVNPHSVFQTEKSRSGDGSFRSEAHLVEPLLTPQIVEPTSIQEAEETFMAAQDETMTTSEGQAAVEPPATAKKQRKPRAKKTVPETSASEIMRTADAGAITSEKPKRGRKAKSITAAEGVKRPAVKRVPRAAKPAPVAVQEVAVPEAVAAASYEMADLLQLEEENQKLRKLLAEKLRAENADLRKRLHLA
jgi:hypothetical protein